MCNIWQNKNSDGLDKRLISKIPHTLRSITLTGGEPFLRGDIADIVERVRDQCPRSRIVITSNGLSTSTIIRKMEEIQKIVPDIAIRISLDGIGRVHNEIRGVQGAYERVNHTLRGLLKVGIRDVGIAYMATMNNLEHMTKTYLFSKQKKLKYTCLVPHSSEFYYMKQNTIDFNIETFNSELEKLLVLQLKSYHPYELFKAYYHKGLSDYLKGARMQYQCCAGELFAYIDTQGYVYPCILLNEKMGSLKEGTLSEIQENPAARKIRKKVDNCRGCWLVCNVAPAIKQNILKALLWVVGNKLKSLTGTQILMSTEV